MLKDSNIDKILDILFKCPTTEFHIRELSRKSGISPPTVLTIVEILKKNNLVKTYKKGNMKIVKASGSADFIRDKRIDNLSQIYETKIVDYLNDLYENPQSIILFGSFSRGDDIEKSDIDIAVITKTHKESDMKNFEKKLSRKVSIHEINVKKVSKEFYNNLINGIVIHGAMQ